MYSRTEPFWDRGVEKLTNEMVKLVSIKTLNNKLRKLFPGALFQIAFYGLHPKFGWSSKIK